MGQRRESEPPLTGDVARGPVEAWLPDQEWVRRPARAQRPALEEASDALGRAGRAGRADPPGRHRRPPPAGPSFLTLPVSLSGARLSGPRAAGVGLLLVVVIAAGFFGLRVAWAKAASVPRVVAPARGGTPTTDSAVVPRTTSPVGSSGFASASPAAGGGSGGGPSAAAATPATVTVHVVGQVKRPGVLHVPGGSRVADAVAAAGGTGAGADPSAINLARLVVDGEQIRVPKLGEQSVGSGAVAAGTGTSSVGSADGSAPGVLVNLNSASAADLDQLPGVGPVLAQRIVDWRAQHGRFASVDELGEVSGIGDKIFAQLRPKVTV